MVQCETAAQEEAAMDERPTAQKRKWARAALAGVMLLVGGGIFGVRAWLGIGWGAEPVARGNGSAAIGLAFNAEDNLSYVAWAQQARAGAWHFSVLDTTAPHRALMVNPYFLAVGTAARALGVQPLLIMNLLAGAAAVLTIWLIWRAGGAMGLRPRGAVAAAGLAALGSGLGWYSILLRLWLGVKAPLGADFCGIYGFYDLFPATAAMMYPYQTVGFCLVAALLWCVAKAERSLAAGLRARGWLVATGVVGAALASMRPYEPAAFLVCYAGAAAISCFPIRNPQSAIRNHCIPILATLTVAMGPFLLYALWVARQPVWSHFAAAAPMLPFSRRYWLVGFGLFWPLAAAGALFARGRRGVNLTLATVWAAFLAVILLGLNLGQSKLAAGGFLALSLLAGHAWDEIMARVGKLKGVRRAVWGAVAVAALPAMCGTLAVVVPFLRQVTPAASGELIAMARTIRERVPRATPAVLAAWEDGVFLPGLAGLRVYAGHPALTPELEVKRQELAAAGLEPGAKTASRAEMERLLAREEFDYVLARREAPAAAWLRENPRVRVVKDGGKFVLFEKGAAR